MANASDYSYLRPLFGENGANALNFEQFVEELGKHADVNLANLKGGGYVDVGKYNSVVAERDTLKTQKAEADQKLTGYDPTWKTQVEQAQKKADAEIAGVKIKSAAISQLKAAGCKDADLIFGTLDREILKLDKDGETVLGLSEQITKAKTDRPFAFEAEKGSGDVSGVTVTAGSKANSSSAGTSELDAIYANNPFYKKT